MGHALAEEIMPIITALWDTADVRNTFTLLMHRWILRQVRLDHQTAEALAT